MKKYIGDKEKAEILAIRNAHVLSLLQTKTPAQIVKIYPDLSVRQITKIVEKDLYNFQQNKAKNEENKTENIENEFFN
jgi:phage FluMu protein gp41